MARALQCPDCGNRHPLDDVAHRRTFRCAECSRLLKVPASVTAAAGGSKGSTARSKAADPDDATAIEGATKVSAAATTNGRANRVPPSQRDEVVIERGRDSARPAAGRDAPPAPRLVRAAIWLGALPLGLIPVVVVGRITGLLSVDRAVDVFVGVGFSRFIPLLLTAVAWALATATVAHLAIEGVERLREERTQASPGRSD